MEQLLNVNFAETKKCDEGDYFCVPVFEKVLKNNAIGDQIGVYTEGNVFEFHEGVDVDDPEVREFIKNTFEEPRAVMGFMRRVL